MGTYFIVTVLAVFLAGLAGSRAAVGPEGTVLPRRTMAAWVLAFACGALLVVTTALREGVGTDFRQYERNYEISFREWTWSQFQWNGEPGIRVISWIAARVHDDSLTMFVLAALITIGLFIRTYAKYSTFFALSVLFFVLTGAWHGSFNGVRQYLAAAIVFAGHNFIVERKLFRFTLVVAVASLFHISAVVLILLYFVPRKRLPFVGVLLLVGVALAASYGYEFAGGILDQIRDQDASSGLYFHRNLNPLRIALAFVPYMVYVLFAQKDNISPRSHFHINIALVFAVLYLAASGSAHLARFGIYAIPFLALAIPATIRAVDSRTRPILTFSLIIAYFVFWYVEVSATASLNPFRWVSFG